MLSSLYNAVLFQPLLNLLVGLYNVLWHDFGLAILFITLIVRLILYPSFKHQLEAQKKMSSVQPKLTELREKHKHDRDAKTRAEMEFYKENKINPFSSCLPMVIQILVLIALYQVFNTGLHSEVGKYLYSFIPDPGKINPMSFGFMDLSKTNNYYLAIITGMAQFIQSKMMMGFQPKPKSPLAQNKDDFAQALNSSLSKQTLYLFPLLTVWIGITLPAGLSFYWLVSTLFLIVQQYLIMKSKTPAVIVLPK